MEEVSEGVVAADGVVPPESPPGGETTLGPESWALNTCTILLIIIRIVYFGFEKPISDYQVQVHVLAETDSVSDSRLIQCQTIQFWSFGCMGFEST